MLSPNLLESSVLHVVRSPAWMRVCKTSHRAGLPCLLSLWRIGGVRPTVNGYPSAYQWRWQLLLAEESEAGGAEGHWEMSVLLYGCRLGNGLIMEGQGDFTFPSRLWWRPTLTPMAILVVGVLWSVIVWILNSSELSGRGVMFFKAASTWWVVHNCTVSPAPNDDHIWASEGWRQI